MTERIPVSRRTFLKGLSAATAPLVLPASVLGRGGVAAPSERIVFGCIGLGGQGRHNMRAMIHQPDTQVIALCDVDRNFSRGGLEPARAELIKEYRKAKRDVAEDSIALYGDYRELLARDDLDAVTVCTPDHWHGLISIHAARSGKDIYCEKPLVNSIREGREVCRAVEQFGRVLQTGSHERSNHSVRFAWELAHNGRLGEIQEIIVNLPTTDSHHMQMRARTEPATTQPVPESLNYDFWLGPAPWKPYTADRCHMMWRFHHDFGGGEITDRGAHILDLAQFLLNRDDSGPVKVTARGKRVGTGLYNCFVDYQFECDYDDGTRIVGTSESPRGLKIVGRDGWVFIHIHGGRLEASNPALLREVIGPSERHTERSQGHHRNFLDAVKLRRRPIAHHEIGQRTATLCHLLNIGMAVQRPLEWDPVTERITNDALADRMTARIMRSPYIL